MSRVKPRQISEGVEPQGDREVLCTLIRYNFIKGAPSTQTLSSCP